MRRMINLWTVPVMFAVLLFGAAGCAGGKDSLAEEEKQAFADVRAEIQSVVADPERAAKAIALISDVEQSFFNVRRSMNARRERFRELNADYDAARADIQAELARILSDIKANQQVVTDVHRQLVDIMTAEEWAAVQKAESKALSAAIKSLQSI